MVRLGKWAIWLSNQKEISLIQKIYYLQITNWTNLSNLLNCTNHLNHAYKSPFIDRYVGHGQFFLDQTFLYDWLDSVKVLLKVISSLSNVFLDDEHELTNILWILKHLLVLSLLRGLVPTILIFLLLTFINHLLSINIYFIIFVLWLFWNLQHLPFP